MQLDEFIEKSLTQIIDGVSKAQEYARSKGASVNPNDLRWSPVGNTNHLALVVVKSSLHENEPFAQMIEFDVAVTATEGDKIKVAAGLFAGAFGVGTQGATEQANATVSHIKFGVPMVLPNLNK